MKTYKLYFTIALLLFPTVFAATLELELGDSFTMTKAKNSSDQFVKQDKAPKGYEVYRVTENNGWTDLYFQDGDLVSITTVASRSGRTDEQITSMMSHWDEAAGVPRLPFKWEAFSKGEGVKVSGGAVYRGKLTYRYYAFGKIGRMDVFIFIDRFKDSGLPLYESSITLTDTAQN